MTVIANNKMCHRAVKIIAAFALFCLLSTAIPQTALAGAGGVDINAKEYTQLGQVANDIAAWAREFANNIAKTAAAAFRKQLLDMMVNEIIKWIQGSGDPRFVNDLGGFLDEAARSAGALTLQQITGPEFMAGLCQPNWALNIRATLEPVPTFGDKAKCSLSDIQANYEEFMNHFTKGGWSAWIKVSESKNNPYMVYMTTLNSQLTKQANKQVTTKEEASFGAGFLGDKVCKTISYYISGAEPALQDGYWNPEQLQSLISAEAQNNVTVKCNSLVSQGATDICKQVIKIKKSDTTTAELNLTESEFNQLVQDGEYPGAECVQWETRSPGKILADATSKSLFKNFDWLVSSEEWESYVVAIGDAIVNRLTKEGVKAIQSYDTKTGNTMNLSGTIDVEPPSTAATIIDPWRVKLSASEPSKTVYTLDGTEPNLYSKNLAEYKNEPLMIVNSTYPGSTPSSLKWRSLDQSQNAEPVRSLPLAVRTPFGLGAISAYIAEQDASIPENIKKDITDLIKSDSAKMLKMANSTSTPKNLLTELNNYIAIEDLRVSLGKATVIPADQLAIFKDLVIHPENYTISNFITLTQGISVLDSIRQGAQTAKQNRDNLKLVVNFVVNASGTGFSGITISKLDDMLGLAPEFANIKKDADRVIAERSLVKLEPWDPGKIYTAIAAVDERSVALLSSKPSLIKFNTSSAGAGTEGPLLFQTVSLGSGYYIQKITLPEDKEYTVSYSAEWTDGSGAKQTEPQHITKLTPPFPNSTLPYIVNLVDPIAEIKNGDHLVKDSDGYITLDPTLSVDFDITPNISGYEWSFSGGEGNYDWGSFDQNRDGTLETYGCLFKTNVTDGTCSPTYNVLVHPIGEAASYKQWQTKTNPGFEAMQIVDAGKGIIKVKLKAATTTSEVRTIKLRVTDDEGLWTEKAVTVTLP